MEGTRAQPSSPPNTSKESVVNVSIMDESLSLQIRDEEAEIARLELPIAETKDTKEENVAPVDERIAKIEFVCSACGMNEMVHYYGKTPPFVYGVKFLEDTYVLRDPFQPPPPRWKPKAEYFVTIGAQCAQCQSMVCRDAECSFYYTRTYCLTCAETQVRHLPAEVQAKLRRQTAMTTKQ